MNVAEMDLKKNYFVGKLTFFKKLLYFSSLYFRLWIEINFIVLFKPFLCFYSMFSKFIHHILWNFMYSFHDRNNYFSTILNIYITNWSIYYQRFSFMPLNTLSIKYYLIVKCENFIHCVFILRGLFSKKNDKNLIVL